MLTILHFHPENICWTFHVFLLRYLICQTVRQLEIWSLPPPRHLSFSRQLNHLYIDSFRFKQSPRLASRRTAHGRRAKPSFPAQSGQLWLAITPAIAQVRKLHGNKITTSKRARATTRSGRTSMGARSIPKSPRGSSTTPTAPRRIIRIPARQKRK